MNALLEIRGYRLNFDTFDGVYKVLDGIDLDLAPGDTLASLAMGILNVNLVAVMFGIHAALPLLKATPGSLCFTTCSASAIFGIGGIAVYSATKHAVRGLTEALSVELHNKGVRAADVLPGLIDTGMMSPERKAYLPKEGPFRVVDPSEVAKAVWQAYHGDKVHWYVPPELAQLDLDVTAAPEEARDKRIEAPTFKF